MRRDFGLPDNDIWMQLLQLALLGDLPPLLEIIEHCHCAETVTEGCLCVASYPSTTV